MAKAKKEEAAAPATATGQGRAVMMPDGKTRRVDYIKAQYYDKNQKRGDIARDLTDKFDKKIPYQIVFAATKLSHEDHAKALKAAAAK